MARNRLSNKEIKALKRSSSAHGKEFMTLKINTCGNTQITDHNDQGIENDEAQLNAEQNIGKARNLNI